MQTTIVAAITISYVLLVYHLYFGDTPRATFWHQDSTASKLAYDTPVLSVFQQASAFSRSLAQQPKAKVHDRACCTASDMHSVLGTATDFWRAAGVTHAVDDPGRARSLLLHFRRELGKAWYTSFRPIAEANQRAPNNSSSTCRCQSVQLLPAQKHSTLQGTAIMLVLDSWERLESQLQLHAFSLMMLWQYARMHGYGLHIYVHGADLPPWMPVYFIKPAGLLHMMDDLGYENVMYSDWDVMLSPHTAPPLSLFYGEFPKASLLLQGEYNFCAGANLWRNTAEGRALLQTWWDLGAKGCCPTTQHDQTALKHMVLAYLANFTGDASVYGPKAQQRFRFPPRLPPPASEDPVSGQQYATLSTEPPSTVVSKWLDLRPMLKAKGSAVGLVGLDVHYVKPTGQRTSTVAFHSCMSFWWGCVPPDTPALLYHTGGVDMRKLTKPGLAQRMVTHITDWLSVASLPANASIVR